MNIAITGFKGSGKDTLAGVLPSNYVKVCFADALREVCAAAFGLTRDEMLDPMLKEATLRQWPYKSPRNLLQNVGTELFRNNYPGVWIHAAMTRIERSWDDGFKVVCTDMRFPDEFEALRDMGFTTIRVDNPKKVNKDPHESERHIPNLPVHYSLLNDYSSAEHFQQAGSSFFRRIGVTL